MIIDYDHNPALTTDQKLQSLKESVQMALNELEANNAPEQKNNLAKTIIEDYTGSTLAGSSQSVKTAIDTLDSAVDAIADFIVEQGTSGIWTYRKWNSGIAECWGQSSIEQTFAQSVFGNATVYYSYNLVEFPFSFVGTPIVTIGAHDTGGGLCSGEVDGVHSTFTVVRIVGAKSDWTVATIDVHAMGRWK